MHPMPENVIFETLNCFAFSTSLLSCIHLYSIMNAIIMTLESTDRDCGGRERQSEDGQCPRDMLRHVEESMREGSCGSIMAVDESCIDDLLVLEGRIDAMGVFSRNEDKDDLTVLSMRYFNVPYYLAVGYHGMERCKDSVVWKKKARVYYDAFLQRCLDYDALEPGLRRIVEGGGSGRVISREEKIALYKKDKELREGIEKIRKGNGGAVWNEDDEDDDARAVGLMQINMYAAKAVGARQMVEKEIGMLEAMEKMPEEERMRSVEEGKEKANELLAALRQASQGLSSVGVTRQRMREDVFKPSHILPTMTVEQFGELEVRRMREEENKKNLNTANNRAVVETSDDDDDEKLAKARAWDDFKDSHRRGAGNSKLRPTG